jgi:hypothetical protein
MSSKLPVCFNDAITNEPLTGKILLLGDGKNIAFPLKKEHIESLAPETIKWIEQMNPFIRNVKLERIRDSYIEYLKKYSTGEADPSNHTTVYHSLFNGDIFTKTSDEELSTNWVLYKDKDDVKIVKIPSFNDESGGKYRPYDEALMDARVAFMVLPTKISSTHGKTISDLAEKEVPMKKSSDSVAKIIYPILNNSAEKEQSPNAIKKSTEDEKATDYLSDNNNLSPSEEQKKVLSVPAIDENTMDSPPDSNELPSSEEEEKTKGVTEKSALDEKAVSTPPDSNELPPSEEKEKTKGVTEKTTMDEKAVSTPSDSNELPPLEEQEKPKSITEKTTMDEKAVSTPSDSNELPPLEKKALPTDSSTTPSSGNPNPLSSIPVRLHTLQQRRMFFWNRLRGIDHNTPQQSGIKYTR